MGVAIAGIVFAILALGGRRHDHGVTIARPFFGVLLSGVHLFFGCSLPAIQLLHPAEVDSRTAWAYTDPTHGFLLRFPSERWRNADVAQGKLAFSNGNPVMLVHVIDVQTGQTPEKFRARAAAGKATVDSKIGVYTDVQYREGVNAAGNPYTYTTFFDNGPRGRLFIGTSFTYCQAKGLLVILVLEGHPRMASKNGQEAEEKSFQFAADYILPAVE